MFCSIVVIARQVVLISHCSWLSCRAFTSYLRCYYSAASVLHSFKRTLLTPPPAPWPTGFYLQSPEYRAHVKAQLRPQLQHKCLPFLDRFAPGPFTLCLTTLTSQSSVPFSCVDTFLALLSALIMEPWRSLFPQKPFPSHGRLAAPWAPWSLWSSAAS